MDGQLSLFDLAEEESQMQPISSSEAREFLLPRHYSGRTPSISKAFGIFKGGYWKQYALSENQHLISYAREYAEKNGLKMCMNLTDYAERKIIPNHYQNSFLGV